MMPMQKPSSKRFETELVALSAGAGATWSAGIVQSVEQSDVDVTNPSTDVFDGVTITQGQIVLLTGQTDDTENGFWEFDTSASAMTRWTEADASADFIQNRSVQIVSDGTEWAYKGDADPTLGSTSLPFEKIRDSIIADLSVSEAKLSTALAAKIDNKVDKEGADVTLVADTPLTVNHGLNSTDIIVQFRDSTGEIVNNVETHIVNSSSITLRFSTGISGRVVLMG